MVNLTLPALILGCAFLLNASAGLAATGNVPDIGADAAPDHIMLWNGRDLTGWKLVLRDAAIASADVWDADGGTLRLHGGAVGYLRTENAWSGYHLHVEWRWPADANPKSNSGVLVHLHGEDRVWPSCVQLQQKIGSAGQLIGMETELQGFPVVSGQHRAPLLAPPSENPIGEWNSCDIYAAKDTLEVQVNGVRQNHAENLPVSSGSIGLQLEGHPVEFRNLWLRRL